MLAAAVDPGKGLFVEQAHQIVLGSALFHGTHNELVVIAGLVCIRVDGGKLMLAGCALVVLCFGENAQPPQLLIQILHEFGYPGTDGGEIVVVQLLSLGRGCAEKSSACQAQILPLGVQVLGQKEILLLSAHAGDDPVGFRVAKKPQNADGFPGNLLQRAQQRGLLVQRITGIGEKHGGNIQAAVLDKGAGRGVPGGVASGLEGCPQTARGE